MSETTHAEVWAVVELMGHVKLAGRLTEEEKFGAKMGRLDIPASERCEACAGMGHTAFMAAEPCSVCKGAKAVSGFVTQLFGGGSVYRITFVTEAVARQVCKQTSPAPVSAWDFPKALAASQVPTYDDETDDDRDEEEFAP